MICKSTACPLQDEIQYLSCNVIWTVLIVHWFVLSPTHSLEILEDSCFFVLHTKQNLFSVGFASDDLVQVVNHSTLIEGCSFLPRIQLIVFTFVNSILRVTGELKSYIRTTGVMYTTLIYLIFNSFINIRKIRKSVCPLQGYVDYSIQLLVFLSQTSPL